MSELVVFTDELGQRNFIQMVNHGQDKANRILKAWNALPLQDIATPDQLKELIQAPDLHAYAASMLPKQDKPVQLFGITLKPRRVLELMELELSPVVEAIQGDLNAVYTFLTVAQATKTNGLEVNKQKLSEAIKSYQVNAITPREKEVAKAYMAAADSLQKLVEIGAMRVEDILHHAPGRWLTLNGNKIDINAGFYRQIIR